MLILALFPFVVFVALFLWRKVSLLFTSLLSLGITGLLAIFVWRIYPAAIALSFSKGFFVALDILVIVFGAILLLEVLKKANVIQELCSHLEKISGDYRVQVILLAWFFEAFLEGTAGFGTPSAVVAPMLIGLGLSPILGLVVSLLGNSTSVAFGAAGTPIRTGFAGVEIANISESVGLFNMVGFLIPFFMLLTITAGREERWKQIIEALPFCLFSGIAFVVPSFLFSFWGPEFPSILGSIVGLALALLAIKFRIFVPNKERTLEKVNVGVSKIPLAKVLTPYVFLIFLLVANKFLFSNFFNPGILFIVTAGFSLMVFRQPLRGEIPTLKLSAGKSFEPFLIILAMSTMAQLMVNSGNNTQGIPSMLYFIGANIRAGLLPLLAPFIGAFGSFLTGSATVSNIMFGGLLAQAAVKAGMAIPFILSLELAGAAVGNMVALADILPAQAVVGLKGKERDVVAGVIIPCTTCVFLVGVLGLIIIL